MFATGYAIVWVLTLFHAIAIMVLIREVARLRNQAEGGFGSYTDSLPLGSPAPRFRARDLGSDTIIPRTKFDGQRTVLLFLSTDCSTCSDIAVVLARLKAQELEGLVLFCTGEESRCQ